MEVPKHQFGSWRDFKNFIYDEMFDAHGASRGEFFFRGQSDATWSLVSSLDRKYSHLENWQIIEQALLSEFGKRCQNIPHLEQLMSDPLRSLALAQHHGLPTRLLDWSESPYVAAYFAFAGALERLSRDLMLDTDQVAIWVAFSGSDVWKQSSTDQISAGVHFLEIPAWHNKRMHSQSGVFSINNSRFKSVDDYVRNIESSEAALAQYTIPASDVVLAIQDLDLMEISADTLFDSVDGKAQAAETRVLLEVLKQR